MTKAPNVGRVRVGKTSSARIGRGKHTPQG